MRQLASNLLLYGLAGSFFVWLAGPGGFESSKLLWLAVLLAATTVVATLSTRQPPAATCQRPLVTGFILIWLAYLTVRTVTAPGPVTAWLGTLTNPLGVAGWWIIGGLAIAILNHHWTAQDLDRRTRTVMAASWLLILLTWVQLRTGFGVDWQIFDDPTRGRELFGTIGSPAQLGTVAALLLGLLVPDINKHWRSAVNWTALALSALVIISGSTTGLAVMLIAALTRLSPAGWRRTTAVIITAVVVAITLATALQWVPIQRWPSLAARGITWRTGWQAWPEQPLWGWGPNHFALAYDRHYPVEQIESRSITEERAHNLYLETLVETGLVGLLFLLGAIWLILVGRSNYADWLPVWLWLIAAGFNPVTTPVAAVGLLTLIKMDGPTDTRATGRSLLPAGVILSILLVSQVAIIVRTSLTADQAARYSAQLEFSAAATVAERTLGSSWPTHPQLALIAAEARTNSALKTNQWFEADVVATNLEYSRAQSPFFSSALTRTKIGRLWLLNGADNEIFMRTEEDWREWTSHPRADRLLNN